MLRRVSILVNPILICESCRKLQLARYSWGGLMRLFQLVEGLDLFFCLGCQRFVWEIVDESLK